MLSREMAERASCRIAMSINVHRGSSKKVVRAYLLLRSWHTSPRATSIFVYDHALTFPVHAISARGDWQASVPPSKSQHLQSFMGDTATGTALGFSCDESFTINILSTTSLC
jgi:hypothetical protein